MDISEHVKEVCKIGQGKECCRYLVLGPGGFECAKIDKGFVAALNGEVAPTVKMLMDQRVAKGTMVARGDNCEGREELNG